MEKRVLNKFEKNPRLKTLVTKISKLHTKNKTIIIGVQGGQGTGKSTLVEYLKIKLREQGYKVEGFSIDDFYLQDWRRHLLAKRYRKNPFYQIVRGMPGTHRVKLLKRTLHRAKHGQNYTIPIFDKALYHGHGDVKKKKIHVNERQDFVLFEGWMNGAKVVSSKKFQEICKRNKVDLPSIDPANKYHKVMLKYLVDYQPLWKYFDYTIMLKPNKHGLHFKWRNKAERIMKKKKGGGMTTEKIAHFVKIFLPITYLSYETFKAKATIMVNEKHEFYTIRYK